MKKILLTTGVKGCLYIKNDEIHSGPVLTATTLTFTGCPSGRVSRRRYNAPVRTYAPRNRYPPGHPGYRVGLPRNNSNIKRKYQRDVEHIRRSRRQGRRGY